MKAQERRKSSGRVAFDRKGNGTREWMDETVTFRPDIDTQRLKVLGADLSCEREAGPIDAYDPYNRSPLPQSSESRPKRRSLDDLRRLSEEINAARAKNDRKR